MPPKPTPTRLRIRRKQFLPPPGWAPRAGYRVQAVHTAKCEWCGDHCTDANPLRACEECNLQFCWRCEQGRAGVLEHGCSMAGEMQIAARGGGVEAELASRVDSVHGDEGVGELGQVGELGEIELEAARMLVRLAGGRGGGRAAEGEEITNVTGAQAAQRRADPFPKESSKAVSTRKKNQRATKQATKRPAKLEQFSPSSSSPASSSADFIPFEDDEDEDDDQDHGRSRKRARAMPVPVHNPGTMKSKSSRALPSTRDVRMRSDIPFPILEAPTFTRQTHSHQSHRIPLSIQSVSQPSCLGPFRPSPASPTTGNSSLRSGPADSNLEGYRLDLHDSLVTRVAAMSQTEQERFLDEVIARATIIRSHSTERAALEMGNDVANISEQSTIVETRKSRVKPKQRKPMQTRRSRPTAAAADERERTVSYTNVTGSPQLTQIPAFYRVTEFDYSELAERSAVERAQENIRLPHNPNHSGRNPAETVADEEATETTTPRLREITSCDPNVSYDYNPAPYGYGPIRNESFSCSLEHAPYGYGPVRLESSSDANVGRTSLTPLGSQDGTRGMRMRDLLGGLAGLDQETRA